MIKSEQNHRKQFKNLINLPEIVDSLRQHEVVRGWGRLNMRLVLSSTVGPGDTERASALRPPEGAPNWRSSQPLLWGPQLEVVPAASAGSITGGRPSRLRGAHHWRSSQPLLRGSCLVGAPAASARSMTGGRTSRCGGVRHDLKARRFQVAPRSWGSACSRRPLAAAANLCGSRKQAGLSAAEADSEVVTAESSEEGVSLSFASASRRSNMVAHSLMAVEADRRSRDPSATNSRAAKEEKPAHEMARNARYRRSCDTTLTVVW